MMSIFLLNDKVTKMRNLIQGYCHDMVTKINKCFDLEINKTKNNNNQTFLYMEQILIECCKTKTKPVT